MLNKGICKKCNIAHTDEWNHKDENWWKNDGEVYCPEADEMSIGYQDEYSKGEFIKIKDGIPKDCICKLEQIVLGK